MKYFFAIALFAPIAAQANPGHLCNSCNEANYKLKATDTQITGTHYVYDLYNNQVRKYFVTREDIVFGEWTYIAWPDTVEQSVIDGIDAFSDFYHETNGTMKQTVEVDADGSIGSMSGWDLYPGAARNNLLDWASNPLTTWDSENYFEAVYFTLSNVAAALLSAFDFEVNANLEIKIVFDDGSSVVVVFDVVERDYEVDENSILDSQNNNIPFSPSDVNGMGYSYHGGGTDLQRAVDRFSTMGIPITPNDGFPRWACVCTSGCTCSRY